jgi:hypothetical protein
MHRAFKGEFASQLVDGEVQDGERQRLRQQCKPRSQH